MGLEQVIGEVRRDGDERAKSILDDARSEAQRLLEAARQKAQDYEAERLRAARRDAEQLQAQIRSGAEFEARKEVLRTEAELRAQLRDTVLQGFAALPDDARKRHIEKLLATAKQTIASGTVRGAPADEAVLKSQDQYAYAGTGDITGGIVVESQDGRNRLDLSYETLLDDMWRDVLQAEAGLFS